MQGKREGKFTWVVNENYPRYSAVYSLRLRLGLDM